MAAVSQTTRIFLNENVTISSKVSLKFVPKGPINNNPALIQIMALRRQDHRRIYASLGLNELITHPYHTFIDG